MNNLHILFHMYFVNAPEYSSDWDDCETHDSWNLGRIPVNYIYGSIVAEYLQLSCMKRSSLISSSRPRTLYIQIKQLKQTHMRTHILTWKTQVGKKTRWHGGQIHYMKCLHVRGITTIILLLGDNATGSYFINEWKFSLVCPWSIGSKSLYEVWNRSLDIVGHGKQYTWLRSNTKSPAM